jgi:hypothetical protein
LVVLVILATASIWYAFTIDWQQYQDGNPTRLLDVPRGESAEYGGGTFAIDELTVVAGDSSEGREYEVTAGTDLVVVDLSVTPRADGDPDGYVSCDVRFAAPSSDGERIWWPESSNPTSYPESESEAFGCNIAGGPAYVYRQYFVVPSGGATDGAVQITIQEELPLALRLH